MGGAYSVSLSWMSFLITTGKGTFTTLFSCLRLLSLLRFYYEAGINNLPRKHVK